MRVVFKKSNIEAIACEVMWLGEGCLNFSCNLFCNLSKGLNGVHLKLRTEL